MNVTVGSTFSVLRCPEHVSQPTADHFQQPGARQVCAGYAIYGPSQMRVLTTGRGVHGFTLDREIGEFMLTHPDLKIPESTSEFAINASNSRHWEAPIRRYVSECQAGGCNSAVPASQRRSASAGRIHSPSTSSPGHTSASSPGGTAGT